MDDKFQPLQNIVSLGKRLLRVNTELYFITFRIPQLWWSICVLLFPPQAHTRRHPYRMTEKFRHPKPAMQSKALHWCLGDFWRTVPPQAPRAAERAGSCRPSLSTAPQGHSCTPGSVLPSAHYPIKNKYSLSRSNGGPMGIHQDGTWTFAFGDGARNVPRVRFLTCVFVHFTAPRKSYR